MPLLAGEAAGPLAVAADLTDYGTFSDSVVLAAGEDIRSEAGWHIAPSITETLLVDAQGGTVLMLPTLRLKTVTAVRDVSGDTPVVLTGWRKASAGYLERPAGWPTGAETVEVDVVHGYESCPVELLPVIARRARANVTSGLANVRLGSLSVGSTTEDAGAENSDAAVVKRYSL